MCLKRIEALASCLALQAAPREILEKGRWRIKVRAAQQLDSGLQVMPQSKNCHFPNDSHC